MLGPLQKLLLKVFVLIVGILIGTFFILPIFGFDLMKYLVGSVDVEGFFQPQDLSTVLTDYREYADLGHGGMILEKDAGVDNIDEVLEQRMLVTDCVGCSGCYEIYLSNPNIRAYSCSNCSSCGGITENNRFKNCLECNPTSGECSLCEDWGKDYELCKEIENCILECYSNPEDCDKYGCFITSIAHNGVPFDINTLKNVLNDCTPKLLKMDMGHNTEKELCYFDTSDISYYDFDRSHDFYMKYSLPVKKDIKSLYIYDGSLHLTPFYKEVEETFERYRVYVAINGEEENMNYEVSIGNYYWDWFWGEQTKYSCKLGDITTDFNGFGYAEFTEIDSDCGNYDKWKADPEKYPLNGIKVLKESDQAKWFDVYATFYANMPESNEAWTRGLKYSHCNFNTDPEPYLPEKPWWVLLSDTLTSPFDKKDGDVDSAVKVFYDSSLPGGGMNSNKRGNIKISLGRLDTDFLRNCKFDLYICSQDAFVEYDEETVFELTDFFTYLNPANIYKIEKADTNNDGYEETDLIIYNYFEFDLNKNYTLEEIKSAIKTGFRLWEQSQFLYISSGTGINWLTNTNNDGIYESDWDETWAWSSSLLYDEDCWNTDVENYLKLESTQKAIVGRCPNGICKEKLKVRVTFKYMEPNVSALGDGWKRPLYPIITFCSSDASSANYQCSGGFETDPDGVTRECRFGCNGNRCWRGIECEQKTAKCRNCAWNPCDQTCTNDICWSESGGPKPIPSNNGYGKVITDCSACTSDCSGIGGGSRECGCGGSNDCDGGNKAGCWKVNCNPSVTCTYI